MSHDRGCFRCFEDDKSNCGRQDCPYDYKNKSYPKKETSYTLEGYVIAPPTSAWEDRSKVVPDMSYFTFGKTATEAWIRHTQKQANDPDFSIFIQRWFDKGYRLKKAKMTIEDIPNE
jgi:hypothetical protein